MKLPVWLATFLLAGTVEMAFPAAALSSFHLPSGRLVCSYSPAREMGPQEPEQLECEVRQPGYKTPPRPPIISPEQRGMPYADRLSLTATGKALWTYHGDVLALVGPDSTEPVLAYGQSWSQGAFRCLSSVAGVHCVNRAGHGFDLGRWAYRLF